MEDHHSAATKVSVNGAPAEATLSTGAGGVGGSELRWRYCAGAAAERSLSLEADVLGVEANGKEVVVRAFVADGKAGGKRRRRRDYVFEMADGEGAAAAWGDKLRACLDSFGTYACASLVPPPWSLTEIAAST
jgi:sphingosine kinase